MAKTLTKKEKEAEAKKKKLKSIKKLTKPQASIFGVPENSDISKIGYFGPADSSVSRKVTSNKVPTIELGPNNNKIKKKLTRSQERLKGTGLGGNPGGTIDINNATHDDVYGLNGNKGLLVSGMTNRSKQKIVPGKGLPTVFSMGISDNFKNQNFKLGVSSYAPLDVVRAAEARAASPRVSKSVQYKRSKNAGTKLSNMIKLPAFNNPTFYTPPGVPRVKSGQLGKVTSPYGNFSNSAFGLASPKSINKSPTMSQAQFSQNIKLLSSGKSLGDTASRAQIAQSSASSNARLKNISRNKAAANISALKSDPTLAEANAILAEQGADYRYEPQVRRRRRGRWTAFVATVYTGPSTRTSYKRTIHNGRQVTAYRGYSTGQNIGGKPSYTSVVQNYHKNKAVVDFAISNTDIKPTGKYLDTSLNGPQIESRIKSLETLARSSRVSKPYWVQVPQKSVWRGNGLGYSASYKWVQKRDVSYGGGPIKAAGGQLSQAQADEYNRLVKLAPKAGAKGRAAFARHVESVASQKKAKVDKYIDPLDSLYSYATITDDQIKEFDTYGGDLKTNIGEFDSNIDILKQGIAKVQTTRGKADKVRNIGGDYYKDIVSKPLSKISSQQQTLKSQKQSILDREATRGVTLSASKKASLTSEATSLKTQAATLAKQAARTMAAGVNDAGNNHTKIEVRNLRRKGGRASIAAANKMYAQVASLKAQAKQKEQYRDTGVDPTRPVPEAVKKQVSGIDNQLATLKSTSDFFTGSGSELILGGKTVAKRVQTGKIDVFDQTAFTNLGISVPTELVKQKTVLNTSKFKILEKEVLAREATQKALINELKIVQKARIKENADAKVSQINQLVAKRAINRREAQKMKTGIAKDVASQRKQIDGVSDSVPLPDINEFDNDLRSEAQKILDSTDKLATGIKKDTIKARLRQVTRSRKPQSSPIGSVLARGTVVPRPRDEFPNRNKNTTLGSQNSRINNPFINGL